MCQDKGGSGTRRPRRSSALPHPIVMAILEEVSGIDSRLEGLLAAESLQLEEMAACLRGLRQMFSRGFAAQTVIFDHPTVLPNVARALERYLQDAPPSLPSYVPLAIHCFANCLVDNFTTQEPMWEEYSPLFFRLLVVEDKQLQNFVCLLLHLLVLYNKRHAEVIVNSKKEFRAIALASHESEFANYILELMVKFGFYIKMYDLLPDDALVRITLTHCLLSLIETQQGELCTPDIDFLELSKRYQKISDRILKTVSEDVESVHPAEVSLLLETLSKVSASEKHLKILQSDTSLLINSAYLLQSIHSAEKSGHPSFQVVSGIPENHEALRKDPVYAFKFDLVKLIGNLSWKNKKNQDSFRDTGGIPFLLDCCKVDARNPFILQQCIFALRCLLENNPENQEIIRGLKFEGSPEVSSLLYDSDKNKWVPSKG